MITKFAEVTLAVRYRKEGADGKNMGGPMYMIEDGLSHKYLFLAKLYCFFGAIAAFGVGNATQINAVVSSIQDVSNMFHYDFDCLSKGILVMVIVSLILFISSTFATLNSSMSLSLMIEQMLCWLLSYSSDVGR
jgi:AGCS family alanine or glycine:cation symporter